MHQILRAGERNAAGMPVPQRSVRHGARIKSASKIWILSRKEIFHIGLDPTLPIRLKSKAQAGLKNGEYESVVLTHLPRRSFYHPIFKTDNVNVATALKLPPILLTLSA